MKQIFTLFQWMALLALGLMMITFIPLIQNSRQNWDNLPTFLRDFHSPAVVKEAQMSNFNLIMQDIVDTKWDVKGNGSTPSCVKHHAYIDKWINQTLTQNKGHGHKEKIQLLAAFEYQDQVSVSLLSHGLIGQPVLCHYLSADFKPLGPPSPGSVYPFHIVNCCKKDGAAYVGVSLDDAFTVTNFVPLVRRKKEPEHTLSVCVSPIFGNTPTWLLLTELIEHYKLQNAAHFYVYVRDMDDNSRKVLESYVQTGEVEAIYMGGTVYPKLYLQQVAINDCIIRARDHSKYVVNHDLDERITPLNPKKNNVRDYVVNFFKNETNEKTVGMLSFRQTWILRTKVPPNDYKGNQTLQEHLPTLNYHNTSGVAEKDHTAKWIADPHKVLYMWIHDYRQLMDGIEKYFVPPEDFTIRHYRDVALSDWEQVWLKTTLVFGNYTNTNYPEELLTPLYNNVKQRLDMVFQNK